MAGREVVASTLYFSEGARIDHAIRAKGFFCLVNLEGTKITVYGMGKPVPSPLCDGLNAERGRRGAALTTFLINSARIT